jgi:hypothetical protein
MGDSRQRAVGSGQWAVGSRQSAVGSAMPTTKSMVIPNECEESSLNAALKQCVARKTPRCARGDNGDAVGQCIPTNPMVIPNEREESSASAT